MKWGKGTQGVGQLHGYASNRRHALRPVGATLFSRFVQRACCRVLAQAACGGGGLSFSVPCPLFSPRGARLLARPLRRCADDKRRHCATVRLSPQPRGVQELHRLLPLVLGAAGRGARRGGAYGCAAVCPSRCAASGVQRGANERAHHAVSTPDSWQSHFTKKKNWTNAPAAAGAAIFYSQCSLLALPRRASRRRARVALCRQLAALDGGSARPKNVATCRRARRAFALLAQLSRDAQTGSPRTGPAAARRARWAGGATFCSCTTPLSAPQARSPDLRAPSAL